MHVDAIATMKSKGMSAFLSLSSSSRKPLWKKR